MPDLSAYAPALISVVAFALLAKVVGIMAGMGKTARGIVPGSMPAPDYGDRLYRTSRASANAIESMGIFASVTVVAVLAGVDPVWTNRLAVAVVLFRLAMVVVHVQGIGRPDRSIRTVMFMGGWLATAGLAVMTLGALLSV